MADRDMDAVRIDKWLWAARFFKTRSLASQAVSGGHVDVNGSRVKPARAVQAGDLLAIRRDQVEWTVQVLAVSDRRGPATVARTLGQTRWQVCWRVKWPLLLRPLRFPSTSDRSFYAPSSISIVCGFAAWDLARCVDAQPHLDSSI